MNILILTNDKTQMGGASIAAKRAAAALSKDTVFYLDYNDLDAENSKSIKIIIKLLSPLMYIYNPFISKSLDKFLKSNKIDICNLHQYIGLLTSAALIALKKNNVKIIQTVHDYRNICPANALLDTNNKVCEKCKSNLIHTIIKKCGRGNYLISIIIYLEAIFRSKIIKTILIIDKFHYVSEFSKEKHIQFEKGYSKGEIQPNYSPQTNLSRDDLSVYRTGSDLIYVGRLSREKGLLEIVKSIKKTKIKFDIYGAGPLKSKIEEIISDADNIIYHGEIENAQVSINIAKYKFLVIPSIWYENNPLTALEALSVGVPLLVSNMGGLPELVTHGSGKVFNTTEEIKDILNEISEKEYIKMCENAKSVFKNKYSFEIYQAKFKKLLITKVQE